MIDKHNNTYRMATLQEKQKILSMDINSLTELFKDAPTVLDGDVVYAVIGEVAYPLRELAETEHEVYK
jgi:hypothetical protein